MKPEIRKIVTRSALFFGILAVSAAGMQLAAWRNEQNAPDAVTASAAQSPVIVLDAGHGGIDGGCSSADGIPEKGINLNILLNLRGLLEISGYEVRVTRDTDRSIHDPGIEGIANQKSSDMDNRLAILNEPENAVCISIHQNQFTDPQYSGAQIFYAPTNPESEGLAQSIQTQFRTLLQPQNEREIKRCGKELFLCWYCEHPMVMAECGFLSNPEEAARLSDPDYQHQVALTLYAGLTDWLSQQHSV